jgi:microcystin-dependent protein
MPANDPYLGEIFLFGGNFAPQGWAFCNGQLLAIAQNDALFALLGTTYGGDGQVSFALPDLRSRAPIHMGAALHGNFTLGEVGGVETVTLTVGQLPSHTHAAKASPGGNVQSPANAYWSTDASGNTAAYNNTSPADPDTTMAPGAITPAGGNQPHHNVKPFTCVSYIICLSGLFPPQS